MFFFVFGRCFHQDFLELSWCWLLDYQTLIFIILLFFCKNLVVSLVWTTKHWKVSYLQTESDCTLPPIILAWRPYNDDQRPIINSSRDVAAIFRVYIRDKHGLRGTENQPNQVSSIEWKAPASWRQWFPSAQRASVADPNRYHPRLISTAELSN